MNFVAKRYRYADGVAYKLNVYDLWAFYTVKGHGETAMRLGGALVLKDKAIAFIGHAGGSGVRVKDIMAYADSYVWGDTLQDALAKIKPQLEAEFKRKI